MLYYTNFLQIKSFVADAFCISVCARERYVVVTGNTEFMHHSNQKDRKKYIQSSKGYKS